MRITCEVALIVYWLDHEVKCVKFNIEGPAYCVRLNLVKLMSKGIKDFRHLKTNCWLLRGCSNLLLHFVSTNTDF